MSKRKRAVFITVWILLMALVLIAAFAVGGCVKHESIQEVVRDAVLHGSNKISLLGIKNVNPAIVSAMTVSGILLVFAAIVRIFIIPRFQVMPGKFQLALEELVRFFDNLAKTNSPHRNSFLGAYIFAAGINIFIGTLFESYTASTME